MSDFTSFYAQTQLELTLLYVGVSKIVNTTSVVTELDGRFW